MNQADQYRRAFKISLWGALAILVTAFTVLLPLKLEGLLPAQMTWLRIILGPVCLAALLPVPIQIERHYPQRFTLGMFLFVGILFLILLGICAVEGAW